MTAITQNDQLTARTWVACAYTDQRSRLRAASVVWFSQSRAFNGLQKTWEPY